MERRAKCRICNEIIDFTDVGTLGHHLITKHPDQSPSYFTPKESSVKRSKSKQGSKSKSSDSKKNKDKHKSQRVICCLSPKHTPDSSQHPYYICEKLYKPLPMDSGKNQESKYKVKVSKERHKEKERKPKCKEPSEENENICIKISRERYKSPENPPKCKNPSKISRQHSGSDHICTSMCSSLLGVSGGDKQKKKKPDKEKSEKKCEPYLPDCPELKPPPHESEDCKKIILECKIKKPADKKHEGRKLFKTTVTSWKSGKQHLLCPHCDKKVQPIVKKTKNTVTKNPLLSSFLLGCWPLCFLCPWQFQFHFCYYCPSCRKLIKPNDKDHKSKKSV